MTVPVTDGEKSVPSSTLEVSLSMAPPRGAEVPQRVSELAASSAAVVVGAGAGVNALTGRLAPPIATAMTAPKITAAVGKPERRRAGVVRCFI